MPPHTRTHTHIPFYQLRTNHHQSAATNCHHYFFVCLTLIFDGQYLLNLSHLKYSCITIHHVHITKVYLGYSMRVEVIVTYSV